MSSSFPIKRVGLLSLLALAALGVALAVLLKFTSLSSHPPVAPAWPAKCGAWSRIADAHPNPGGTQLLLGVAAVSPTQAWAVGRYVTTLLSTVGLIEQWDGSAWRVIPHPSAGPDSTSEYFNAVAGTTPQDMWAVGDYVYRGARQSTLIEHWNGSSWSIIATPNPGSSWNELNAIAAVSAHDAWAVGNSASEGAPLRTLIEHWDGTHWSVVDSPNVGSDDNNLLGVAATSPQDVWAVGRYFSFSTSTTQTLLEHWDGTHWSIVDSPDPANNSFTTYTAVTALAPQDAWAVGWYNTTAIPAISHALIEHWDGTRWQRVPTPEVPAESAYLLGITAISPHNAWAVGSRENPGSQQVLIEHWDGTRWSIFPQASASTSSDTLRAAASVPGTSAVWAVGLASNSSFSEFYC